MCEEKLSNVNLPFLFSFGSNWVPKFTLLLVGSTCVYLGILEAFRVKKMYRRKHTEYEGVNLHYLQKYNTTQTYEKQTNFEESLSHDDQKAPKDSD